MSDTSLISVIIPVYNKEKVLERCIGSVIKQTYTNIEIIIVDDNSTDCSATICDKYENEYENIQAAHCKKNGGVGKARNIGLHLARGEYIAFVDSDDYLDSKYLEVLYNLLVVNKADISLCGYTNVFRVELNEPQKGTGKEVHFSGTDAIKDMWYKRTICNAPWAKLFKRKLWTDIDFREVYCKEDYATIYKTFLKTDNIVYTEQFLYFYCYDKNSLSNSFYEKLSIPLDICSEVINDCRERIPVLSKAALCKGIDMNFEILCQMPNIKEFEYIYMRAKSFIKKNRYKVLLDSNARAKTKIAILCSYISFSLLRKLYKFETLKVCWK